MFGSSSSNSPDGAESEGARQQTCQCYAGSSDPISPKTPHPFHTSIAITRGIMHEECAEVGMTGARLSTDRPVMDPLRGFLLSIICLLPSRNSLTVSLSPNPSGSEDFL